MMNPINAFFRVTRDLVMKGMIIVSGICFNPGAILCYFFPSVAALLFFIMGILLIIGLIVASVFFVAWQILGVKTRKGAPLPQRGRVTTIMHC